MELVGRDYNFGIPELPYISGRDLVGEVIRTSKVPSSRMKVGDNVINMPATHIRAQQR